jgi:hypothetical protein
LYSSKLTLNDVSATSIPSMLSLEAILSDYFLLVSSILVTCIPVTMLSVSCLSHIARLDLSRPMHTSTTHSATHSPSSKHHYRTQIIHIITTTDYYSNHSFNDKFDTSGIVLSANDTDYLSLHCCNVDVTTYGTESSSVYPSGLYSSDPCS